MPKYGLLGKNIEYSFSKKYFEEKFQKEHLSDSYENFDIPNLSFLPEIISKFPALKGLNVTIPYKEKVIPFCDKITAEATEIGAVNVIKIESNGNLSGHNTDYFGFIKSLEQTSPLKENTALVLGTGGASKAIQYALKSKGFRYKTVSRKGENGALTYRQLTKEIIETHLLIINCTPVGTFPNIESCPKIPYQFVTSSHLLFDLIYNPLETKFLKLGRENGAQTCNGLYMLIAQAEKSWEIWNSEI